MQDLACARRRMLWPGRACMSTANKPFGLHPPRSIDAQEDRESGKCCCTVMGTSSESILKRLTILEKSILYYKYVRSGMINSSGVFASY